MTRCPLCLRFLPPRRWWQRGPFAPLPVCRGTARVDACRRTARAMGRNI